MSTTTQYTTFSDLYTGLQNRVRADTTQTAGIAQAKQYINTALHDIHIGFAERLSWCERRGILTTQAPYTTGTLTATKGSATITGSGTTWNASNDFSVNNMQKGGKVRINGGTEVYEVSSVTNDTTAVLTSKFTQTTVSAASYVYFEDEYALASDFLRPIDFRQFSDPMDIGLIGRAEFRRSYPRNYTTGRPQVGTIYDLAFSSSTTPVRKIAFYKVPDQVYMIPYSYATSNLAVSSAGVAQSQLSADSDEPIVPLRYRHVLVYHALYNWYRDKSDDDRSMEVKGEYQSLLSRITGDTEIGADHPQLTPSVSAYSDRARRPYNR